ncbi:CpsB/CapC family capsule biosynthesis tyrosine phosphatase [Ruminococcus sp.]|uniref:CpsB/CapC family capsule biosynthesis tyrosine phosphatase n=1 Tax=Ruminococcus sp. TaxID=41978 RepID=UPI0025D75358|nr:CpsB/CapC family capsule biosynthesis tyrosine phosphatase [Ruminococcus sp.]
MLTDCHNHILPEMDDGSKSVEMSVNMLQMMQKQGITRVLATPHFYCHREKSVASYLERRQRKFEKLMEANPPISNILLGAEVAIEKGLCDTPEIEKLAIEGTDLILLELPYAPYQDWMEEEIDNIAMTYHLTPILAHVHRYFDWYSKAQIKQMMSLIRSFRSMQRHLKAFRSEKLRKK